MVGVSLNCFWFTGMTLSVFQFSWTVKQPLAFVALISLTSFEFARRTRSNDISVSQTTITLLAETLCHLIDKHQAVVFKISEYLLGDGCVPWSACSTKIVKVYIKPLIDPIVNLKVVITCFFRGLAIFECFDLSCCSILVCSANVHHIVTIESLKACKNIGRENTTNDVA